MSTTPRPAGRPFNPAWLLLLLLPAGLLVGRLLGNQDVPAAKAGGPAPVNEPAGAGGLRWVAIDQALAEARRTGKPVMFDFNADWCPPCQRMKHDVFEQPAYARRISAAVVPVSVVDRYRETGANPPEIAELQQRFNIEAFPTLVVMSPTSGRFVSQAGFGGPDYTAQWVEEAVKQVR